VPSLSVSTLHILIMSVIVMSAADTLTYLLKRCFDSLSNVKIALLVAIAIILLATAMPALRNISEESQQNAITIGNITNNAIESDKLTDDLETLVLIDVTKVANPCIATALTEGVIKTSRRVFVLSNLSDTFTALVLLVFS